MVFIDLSDKCSQVLGLSLYFRDCFFLFASVMTHVHRFLGNSALWWDLKNDVTISAPWYLGLVFRTRAREGTLLQAQAGQYISLVFQVGTNTFNI